MSQSLCPSELSLQERVQVDIAMFYPLGLFVVLTAACISSCNFALFVTSITACTQSCIPFLQSGLFVDPLKLSRLVREDLALIEPERDLFLGVFDTVRSVAYIAADILIYVSELLSARRGGTIQWRSLRGWYLVQKLMGWLHRGGLR